MKTGTTYVQNLLQTNRTALQQAGWSVPRQARVVRAVRQVMGLTDAGKRAGAPRPSWDELVVWLRREAGAGRGALVSMEFLSYAAPQRAREVLAGLDEFDVHVVLSVRDAAGALPSQWQSLTRNGGLTAWPDFAHAIRTRSGDRRPGPAVKAFRRTQDVPRMLETWGGLLGPDRFSVVTVPDRTQPREEVWRRLLSVAGIDMAETSTEDAAFGNPRLGYGSCELLRRLNVAGLGDAPPSAYRRVVRFVARHHLLPLRDQETQPRLDSQTAAFAAGLNARTRALAEQYATVVGDLEDLPVEVGEGPFDPGARPQAAPEDDVRRAGAAALSGATAYCREHDIDVPAGADVAEIMLTAVRATARGGPRLQPDQETTEE